MKKERTTLLSERAPNRNYSSTRGVEVRFTKIPLIATLMAVALSLLIVLPGLAQQATDITDGKQSSGGLSVGVFDDIADAQVVKLEPSTFDFRGLPADKQPAQTPHVPVGSQTLADFTDDAPTTFVSGTTEGTHLLADNSYLANLTVDPRNTFFDGTLYVSNDPVNDGDDGPGQSTETGQPGAGVAGLTTGAFNTVLIDVTHEEAMTTCVREDPADAATATDKASVTATVRNNRTGGEIDIQLVSSSDGTTAGIRSQAFFKVVQDGDTGVLRSGADGSVINGTDGQPLEVEYRQFGGPTWCDDDETREHDPDLTNDPTVDDRVDVEVETPATSAVYGPIAMPGLNGQPRAGDAPPAQQEIATIFANHGDRLTVTTSASSAQIELVVDGEGPDFSGITPDDNAVSRPSRLTFGFEVRDDDSGLRHDGESILTRDDDYEEINPDGDHQIHDEPLSENPQTAVGSNGKAADIDVNLWVNRALHIGDTSTKDDISASGRWSSASSRAGVAYAFTASGAGRDELNFLYQLEATDRAGNTSMTDADPDVDGTQPFVFRVDDTEPALTAVRTGVSWDAEKDQEVAGRSYIALSFNNDPLGDIDTENISVVGHTIVGYIHPSETPVINRGDTLATTPPTGSAIPDEPTMVVPEAGPAPNADDTSTNTDPTGGATDPTASAVTSVLTANVVCELDDPDTTQVDPKAKVDPAFTGDPTTITITDADRLACQWVDYNKRVADRTEYETENTAYVNYVKNRDQYYLENPFLDLDGDRQMGVDPRARIYIELAEDLASDAEPTVLVVGGAVFDLAGNTNESKTVSDSTTPRVEDWIAPKISVTVTGTANDRPVANEDGSFTLDVRSDEDLGNRPVVYFVSVSSATVHEDDDPGEKVTGFKYTIDDSNRPSSPLTSEEDANHWSKKYNVDSATFTGFDGLVGVIVVANDEADNTGATKGWSPLTHRKTNPAGIPAGGQKLSLAKMDDAGLLVEVDRQFNGGVTAGIGTVTPRSNADGTETESANPFVKLSFSKEKGEYDSCPAMDANGDDFECKDPNPGAEFKDSHSKVTITEITLNGENAMAQLSRVSSTEFSLVLRDVEDAVYTVEYTAADDAGNEMDNGEFEFEKVAREPYEVEVSPGWNLISLPASPLEPAIGDVLANNQYISPVLGYQEGDWITAIREDDGTWRGRLTEITGGYGYWVHARTFESIETMLAEVDPAGTLPTVPVTAGWNLLGVLDIFQNDEGVPPGASVPDPDGGDPTVGNAEADDYFNSIPWKVAYTYDTAASLWVKTVPEDEDDMAGENGEVLNGNGYWVWSPVPTTLVP